MESDKPDKKDNPADNKKPAVKRKIKVPVKETKSAPPITVKRKKVNLKHRQWFRPRKRPKAFVSDKKEYEKSVREGLLHERAFQHATLDPKLRIPIVLGLFLAAAIVVALAMAHKRERPQVFTIRDQFMKAGVKYIASGVFVEKNVQIRLYTVKEKDLSKISHIPIKALLVRDRSVDDVSGLKGMPLMCLLLNDTQVADISALKGMPLEYLDVRGTRVTDISVVEGMPLKSIAYPPTVTNGIEILRGMKTLRLINKREPYKYWPQYDSEQLL